MNMFIENVRLAFTSLKANKSRAFLTMLGIIIGIASVIAIMTVGNSLTLSVSSSMQSMGANNITVSVSQRSVEEDKRDDGIVFGSIHTTQAVGTDDYITDEMIHEMLEHFSDSIEAVSASESLGNSSVKNEGSTVSVSVIGVSQGYFVANEMNLLSGKVFLQEEASAGKNVVLVADKFVDKLFQESYAEVIGRDIVAELNGQMLTFTIVGVYEQEESSFGSSDTTNCYIPLKTAQNMNHSKNYSSISIVSKVGVDSDSLAVQIETFLNGYYRNNRYFEINAFSMSSMVSIMGDMMSTITTAISVIAGIALLVGGIGVMNIMLVSITERTREIGTRKALGATNNYIRMQFIIEAMIICLIGGAIGVLLGVGMGMLAASLLGYAASPSMTSIIGSLAFSLAIGIFFGYYPANKAAKMNPIEALRYE